MPLRRSQCPCYPEIHPYYVASVLIIAGLSSGLFFSPQQCPLVTEEAFHLTVRFSTSVLEVFIAQLSIRLSWLLLCPCSQILLFSSVILAGRAPRAHLASWVLRRPALCMVLATNYWHGLSRGRKRLP